MKIIADPTSSRRPPRHAASAGFSLIEILVTVALLSFIILGLLAMFHQTQRAFRSSITQTDVLEGGRAVTEMMARDLEQLAPSHAPFTMNFFAEISGGFTRPLVQNLPGMTANDLRTNVVQRFFFLSELNRQWTGQGYQVIPSSPDSGVGTLYRITASAPRPERDILNSNFQAVAQLAYDRALAGLPLTNLPGLTRVLDGVVHLRVRAYATNGFPITRWGWWDDRLRTNLFLAHTAVFGNDFNPPNVYDPAQTAIYFRSNAVPAYVELELGILEPKVFERSKALGTPEAARQFLAERSAHVHLFRQRIPIRNVDHRAYQ